MSGVKIVYTVIQKILNAIAVMIYIGNCQDRTIGSVLTGR